MRNEAKDFLYDQEKIAITVNTGIIIELLINIAYIEAHCNYVKIYLDNDRSIMVSKTLKEIESIINKPDVFIRIHKSFLVNLNHVKNYDNRGNFITLYSGIKLQVSQRKIATFNRKLLFRFNKPKIITNE